MIIDQPGKVTERIFLLGRPESCVYLLQEKNQSIILGGGMAYIAPDVIEQLQEFDIDEKRISRICILHSHFDHCGAVPFFKKRWPQAVVTASPRARELLSKPDVSETIGQMNHDKISEKGLDESAKTLGFEFTGIDVEEAVAEGDAIKCGDARLNVLDTPGHSSCSISMYMPEEKALFASDSVGLRRNGVFQPTPNSNFDQYQKSLEKLAGYPVDVLLLEHYGAYLEEEARNFIPNAIEAAGETRRLIEETYKKTRDIEKCTKEITDIFQSRFSDSFLSREVREMVSRQMVRFIAKKIEQS